jgi:hypothetical protein
MKYELSENALDNDLLRRYAELFIANDIQCIA